MILQALYDYYQRKAAFDVDSVAPEGFEYKEIPFVIVIDKQGKFVDLQDTREPDGKKLRAKSYLVPQAAKKTSGVKSNLLWDNHEYVLGVSFRDEPDEKIQERHKAFCALLTEAFGSIPTDESIRSVLSFLGSAEEKAKLQGKDMWSKIIAEKGGNFTFRIEGDTEIIAAKETVKNSLRQTQVTSPDGSTGVCLVTGAESEIERVHPSIKGVWGGQTSGANIVSFNARSYESYGYENAQGLNSPVGKSAAFAYTTALNALLGKDSKQRVQIGDASTVFWAEKATPFEDFFGDLITDPKDDPDRHVKAVESLYKSARSGERPVTGDENTKFYILGLSPNAARIAVRFWYVATIAEISGHIVQHYDDIEICHSPNQHPYPSLFRLLSSIAVQEKSENIPPNLAGDTMRAIIAGTPYPETFLQAAIRRNRASQDVQYTRAALIKACLNRSNRYYHKHEKELTMALDPENVNIGYNLGRLFAVLEKIQEEANPSLNATIRDRYYGAASSSPISVFSTLMKLKNHHLSKLDNKGRVHNFEKEIAEIMGHIETFPNILRLDEQGRFAIGYYHQRQNFFTKKSNPLEEKEVA